MGGSGRVTRVEKILVYVGRAHECQILAVAACVDDDKAEYLALAQTWIELAEARRQFLIEQGRTKLH